MLDKKCGYCGKPVKTEEVIKSTLLYRNGSQLARKEKEYCSKRCASHDAGAQRKRVLLQTLRFARPDGSRRLT
ncbi:TPA: hypothetical protein OT311_001800 [Citrobacter freundii]|nr:hypothetical protein [Citrobacter freundii]